MNHITPRYYTVLMIELRPPIIHILMHVSVSIITSVTYDMHHTITIITTEASRIDDSDLFINFN